MRYTRRGIGMLAAVLLLAACGDSAGESAPQTVDMNVIKTYEHKVVPETKADEPGDTGDTPGAEHGGGQPQTQPGSDIAEKPEGFTETNDVVVVAVSKLNLRSGPSTDTEIIAQVKFGDTFTRLAKGDNGWDMLLYGDQIVYAFAEYLAESPEPQQDGRQSLEYYASAANVKKN